MQSASSPSRAPVPSSGNRAARQLGRKRWIWLVVSGTAFAVTTLTAFLQPPRDNPLDLKRTAWQWFTQPIERNSWRRLPSIANGLLNVFFSDRRHGWAVGLGGTILATVDGGANWKPESSGTQQDLLSIHFADADHGWVVGRNGTILATTDRGVTWRQQTSGTQQDLYSMGFTDASRGWAVGDRGTILTTADGGANWKSETSGTQQDLYSVYFTDTSRGWAVGAKGTILTTADGGANWKSQTSGTQQDLESVYFGDATRGWAVGDRGTIVATADGGTTWKSQISRTQQYLESVYFADASRGWVAGLGGTILATADGGVTWRQQTSGTQQDLESIYFVDPNHGWAVGDGGTIRATTDGGTWKPESLDINRVSGSVFQGNSSRGWILDLKGTIAVTDDGGANWRQQALGTQQDLLSIYFADASLGWIVGRGGTILATTDGGVTWKQQTSGTQQDLLSIYFADPNHGWAVGSDGTILATADGGANWKPQISGTQENLLSVYFADASHGWAVSAKGTLLSTADGGANWRAPGPPSRYPAPWYYLAVLLCLLVALPGLRPETVAPPTDSAANRQVSDNPIGPGDPDALGLGDIALGLSQFFRNLDTKPPLTVGILGEWGQGKSSVMRLLEADLKRNGVYPVWFNAWHYQKEDHLLAYLLEAVRKQAVPKLQTVQGLRFRARILGLRAARGRWAAAALVILLAFCIGLLRHPEIPGRLADWAVGIRHFSPDAWGQFTVLGLSLGTILLISRQFYAALKAFHVNPAALIKQAAGSASIKDLGEKTSLRMAFAKEFSDVTRALDPYRLVIFIDDLDRCNPGSVTQILESVNFLTSAGDCFVVMGLAKAQVEASVGLSFKDVAEELGDSADAKEKRRVYAQQYLRKLINLEVNVPAATSEQQLQLLGGGPANAKPETKSYAERLAAFGQANRPVAWVAITLLLAGASLWYGMNFTLSETPNPPQPIVMAAPGKDEKTAASPPVGQESKPIGQKVKEEKKPEVSQPVVFVPGVPEVRNFIWLPVIPGLVLLGFIAWALTRRPNEIIQDSKNFTEALEIWQPVIGRQYKTPREIKRFLNRVRYIAMRWRKPSPQKTLVERWADWLQHKLGRTKPGQDRVDEVPEVNEAGIVLMAAVECLGGEKFFSTNRDFTYVHFARAKHKEHFGELGEDWQRFREITGEIETN